MRVQCQTCGEDIRKEEIIIHLMIHWHTKFSLDEGFPGDDGHERSFVVALECPCCGDEEELVEPVEAAPRFASSGAVVGYDFEGALEDALRRVKLFEEV